ncbi:MAG TPA: heme biosynthesis HemY N-terminal domain-containing protein [Devosiaceae bacterium]
MRRLILALAASLAIAALAAWLIALPGTMSLDVAGFRLQPRLGTVLLLAGLFVILVIAVWAILRRIIGLPRFIARRTAERRRAYGVDALSQGMIALEAGEAERARQLARDAHARLPGNAAAQLLEAQASLAMGDLRAARDQYRTLISDEKTALAALSGLYRQAQAQGRGDAALTFARKAARMSPGISWATDAVFDDLTRRGAWQEALEIVASQPVPTREAKRAKRRRQAVLETAMARDLEEKAPNDALDHALAALKLVNDLVPAALIAARIYINRGDGRRAASLLRRVWRTERHPDLATLYANVQPGASAVERLRKIRELIGDGSDSRETAMVLARAAIDAYEWPAARNALARYAAAEPTQGVCALMAEIEEGQNGDQGKAREWFGRALRAPRDPAWVADGTILDEWAPVSPVTGKLDAVQWKVPTTSLARAPAPDANADAQDGAVPAGTLPPGGDQT